MNCTCMKQILRVKFNGVICASWENDKNWIEIHIEKEWKEIIKQTSKILAPKDNGNLLCCLIIAISKRKDIISRLKT